MFFTIKKSLLLVCLIFLAIFVSADKISAGTATPPSSSSNRTLYVKQFVDEERYYDYELYLTAQGKLEIEILNYDLTKEQLLFSKSNPLYYRASYYNFIILQEMKGNQTVTYWVLEIVQNGAGGHQLQFFAVDSNYDYYDYNLDNNYILTSIIEYDSTNGLLYVTLRTKTDTLSNGDPGRFGVYAIDIKNKGGKLYTSNWFYFTKSNIQRIVGGNSRVLVEATNNQFWIVKSNNDKIDQYPTTYDKIDISNFTTLQIYPGGSRVYKLRGTYFQYVSISPDGKKISTFVYHGYGRDIVLGQAHLQSLNPIKIFSDQATFFIAISDDDVYITIMVWDSLTQQFIASSRSFKQSINDSTKRARFIAQFTEALVIQQHDGKLFLLTPDRFSVYLVEKIYQTALLFNISPDDDLEYLLFAYMRQYNRNLLLQ